jgi:hypothetical protein
MEELAKSATLEIAWRKEDEWPSAATSDRFLFFFFLTKVAVNSFVT